MNQRKQCKRCYVSGRVQGVYYRSSTRSQAMALGVTGSAVNLSDGTVLVTMCGDADALESLCNWLWQGPQYAKVENVECEIAEDVEVGNSFNTG